MRLLPVLTAALALTLSACDSGPGPDLADGPILPLAPGNSWTYAADDGGTLRLAVGEEVDVEGEGYFRLLVTIDGTPSGEAEYARPVGDGAELLYTAPLSGGGLYREATVYRYPVPEGTYVVEGREYEVARERVTVPAGTFEVVTYSGYDGDPSVSASFAPGVGIVRFFDGRRSRELVAYDVD